MSPALIPAPASRDLPWQQLTCLALSPGTRDHSHLGSSYAKTPQVSWLNFLSSVPWHLEGTGTRSRLECSHFPWNPPSTQDTETEMFAPPHPKLGPLPSASHGHLPPSKILSPSHTVTATNLPALPCVPVIVTSEPHDRQPRHPPRGRPFRPSPLSPSPGSPQPVRVPFSAAPAPSSAAFS